MKPQFKQIVADLGYQLNITLLEEQLEDIMDAVVRKCASWVAETDSNPDVGQEDADAMLNHFGVKND